MFLRQSVLRAAFYFDSILKIQKQDYLFWKNY
jgi:hypothetical protein